MNISLARRVALSIMLLTAPLASCAADQALLPLPDVVVEYVHRAAAPAAERCTGAGSLALPVALDDARPETRYDAASGRLHIFYPMQFNDLTEGWNWHPEEVAAGRDYYTFKYLLLGSTHENRGSYPVDEITSGAHKDYPVQWRYDYFFAFDNPYAFYPRNTDDATGFAAVVNVSAAEAARLADGDLRMALRGRLRTDCLSESTTFWKGTPSQPRDFTLKKRYLIGSLEEILFYDKAAGKVLARVEANSAK